MKKRSSWLLFVGVVVLLVISLALPGCGGDGDGDGPITGGILRIATQYNPTSLDTVKSTLAADAIIHAQIYDTLLRFDEESNIVPSLCTGWEYDTSNTTLTLNLRSGVKFHDGTDFDAAAVKAHFDRIKNTPTSLLYGDLAYVQSVEVTGNLTLQIETYVPRPTLLNSLAGRLGRINSPAAVESAGDDYGLTTVVGTGPFKFVKWVQDYEVVLTRNDDYWAKDEGGTSLPYLHGVEFKVIPDPATMYSNLVTGYIEMTGIPYNDIEAASEDESLEVIIGPVGLTYGVLVNCTVPPFDNILARQAVAYAIDKTEILEAVAFGYGIEVGSFVPPPILGYDPAITGYPYNPSEAEQLLADAGYNATNPLSFNATVVPLSGFDTEALVMQAQLAEVGIVMNLDVVDPMTMVLRLWYHNFDVIPLATAFTAVPLEAQGTLESLYSAMGGYNHGRIDDTDLETMIQQAGQIMDRDAREAAYSEVQQYLVDQCYDWWFFGAQAAMGLQKYVMGYVHSVTGDPMLERVWLATS